MDDLLDQVGQSTYFSKLDLIKDFYQIPVKPEHHDKTAFCSPWGKVRFTRMPFGLGEKQLSCFQVHFCTLL